MAEREEKRSQEVLDRKYVGRGGEGLNRGGISSVKDVTCLLLSAA